MVSYYNYKDLRTAAESGNPDDLNALGEWFERFGMDYWNGECFNADNGVGLYRIYKEVAEDEFEIIGYELR